MAIGRGTVMGGMSTVKFHEWVTYIRKELHWPASSNRSDSRNSDYQWGFGRNVNFTAVQIQNASEHEKGDQQRHGTNELGTRYNDIEKRIRWLEEGTIDKYENIHKWDDKMCEIHWDPFRGASDALPPKMTKILVRWWPKKTRKKKIPNARAERFLKCDIFKSFGDVVVPGAGQRANQIEQGSNDEEGNFERLDDDVSNSKASSLPDIAV